MFGACVIAFVIGYIIGAVRVGRFVDKRLTDITKSVQLIQQHSNELRQFYSKLESEDSKP
jgi:hypothetical protein